MNPHFYWFMIGAGIGWALGAGVMTVVAWYNGQLERNREMTLIVKNNGVTLFIDRLRFFSGRRKLCELTTIEGSNVQIITDNY
jgi:hypothetical protein